MPADVSAELSAGAAFFPLRFRPPGAPEVAQRELAVDRHAPVLYEDGGGHDDPVAQRMLRGPAPGREHLAEGLLEKHLSERAAQFRRLEQVLQPCDVARELFDLLRRFV